MDTLSQIVPDTMLSCRINYLPEKDNVKLSRPTKIILDDKSQVKKGLKSIKKNTDKKVYLKMK